MELPILKLNPWSLKQQTAASGCHGYTVHLNTLLRCLVTHRHSLVSMPTCGQSNVCLMLIALHVHKYIQNTILSKTSLHFWFVFMGKPVLVVAC